ncbi:MAG: hypothetical protein KTR28_01295 [Micavibrio sp.]|nr:hypothetical protein [Micavibrio sp.]
MSFAELKIPEERINSVIYLDEMTKIFSEKLDFNYNDPQTAIQFTQMAKNISVYGQNSSYPVGGVYWGIDKNDRKFFVPCVNTIPTPIKETLGENEEHIARSHATAHAEMVGLNLLPPYKKLSEATDKSPCPTCMEGLCELSNSKYTDAKLDAVYFDKASLDGEAAQEKWKFSKNMLKPITQNGRVGLMSVDLKNKKIEQVINDIPDEDTPKAELENEIEVRVLKGITSFDQIDTKAILRNTIQAAKNSTIPSNKEATTLIVEHEGQFFTITAAASLPPGFKAKDSQQHFEYDKKTEKRSYLFQEDSLIRCKVTARALGLNTKGAAMVCTRTPSSGMMINAVLYGIKKMITKAEFRLPHFFNKKANEQDMVMLEITGKTGKPAIIQHEAANDPELNQQLHLDCVMRL